MKSQKTVAALVALSALLFGSEIYLFRECSALSIENDDLKGTVATMDATILSMREESEKVTQDANRIKSENEDLKVEVDYLGDQVYDLSIGLAQANNMINELSDAIDESQFEEEKEPEKDPTSINTEPENITEISGMTGAQFNKVIDKIMLDRGLNTCKLAGTGDAFAEVEEKYGINGLYILAIFAHESAFATRCINTNNFGGIRGGGSWKYFATPSDCIYYEGELLRTKYVDTGLVDLDDIGAKYCEGSAWPSRIQELVDEYLDIMEEVVS